MHKFIGTTEAECQAFRQGVEYGDDSGEVKFSEPVQRGDGLWQTVLVEDTEDDESLRNPAYDGPMGGFRGLRRMRPR